MLKPSLQVHDVQGVLVAEFWDCLRLDANPIQELRKTYEAHLNAKRKPDLVIDLLGVGFAGSATLGHFVGLLKQVRQRGGRLVFCNVDPTVRETFRISKLEPMFSFETDRPAALAGVLKPPGDAGSGGQAAPDAVNGAPGSESSEKSSGGTLPRGGRRRKLS
jgi:anti-anti-sigma factor